ncbi:hypothetical protein DSO57_1018253 [Entomophthora muscae]|uniref:Uncharacterized protein n=1 Tax=Entomophthora muscae TaxID=34485 RepID=A0ACC2T479_9FUNG|nr:hypothetical protein DSO57_1018253 [Entomophthora muscae]
MVNSGIHKICAESSAAPPLTTSPPTLATLLEDYKDNFSKMLDQLPPPQEIQHALQLQELLPKVCPLYCLKPKKDETLCQHLVDALDVVNNGIHHVLISPLLGHFEDKSLAFAFDS